jgi:hypothetical protein
MNKLLNFEQFVNESSSNNGYDIIVNKKNTETIYNSDIEEWIEDGYDNINHIIDNYLIQMGYKQNQMENWKWSNPNDLSLIKKKFKLKD